MGPSPESPASGVLNGTHHPIASPGHRQRKIPRQSLGTVWALLGKQSLRTQLSMSTSSTTRSTSKKKKEKKLTTRQRSTTKKGHQARRLSLLPTALPGLANTQPETTDRQTPGRLSQALPSWKKRARAGQDLSKLSRAFWGLEKLQDLEMLV